jgi:nicotinate-nucleotide pyrophosphorylase (carboxylating)
MTAPSFDDDARRCAATLIELALAEDLGTPQPGLVLNVPAGRVELVFTERPGPPGDITANATIPPNARSSASVVARADGVLAGMPVFEMVARRSGGGSFLERLANDGDRVRRGDVLARVSGETRLMLMMERTALNFLQRLSGIATLTARFVAAVAGTRAVILDTRKTTPGWRALEKYAVRCGGGRNHRSGLFDAVLIKDNHLAWLSREADPIGHALDAARRKATHAAFIEIEVGSLDQLDRALSRGPDIILIDNLGPDALAEAVRRRDAVAPDILLEASGGVRLETVGAIARSGVDRISVGALTHSAPALDIALDFDTTADS